MRLMRWLVAGAVAWALVALPAWGAAAEGGQPVAEPGPSLNAPIDKIPHRAELETLTGVKGWVVNGDPIPFTALQDMALRYRGPYMLQDLVTMTLLKQAAKAAGITVSEADVDAQVKSLRKDNGLTEEEPFRRFLQSERVTPEAFRESARMYVYIRKVIGAKVSVHDQDIRAIYDREAETTFRRPEIVSLDIGGGADERVVAAAVAELRKGTSLEDVIKKVNVPGVDPTKALGGNRNVFYMKGQSKGRFPPGLENVIFSAPTGQWVGPVRVESTAPRELKIPPSYAFFKVSEKSAARQFTFEEARDIIRERLLQEKISETFPEWLAGQMKAADITLQK